MIQFNTSDFSLENTKNATLQEKQQILLNILNKISELSFSQYSFEDVGFPLPNKKKDNYQQYIKEKIENLDDSSINKHFHSLVGNVLINLLNYQECTADYIYQTSLYNSYTTMKNSNSYYTVYSARPSKELLSLFNEKKISSFKDEFFLVLDHLFEHYGLLTEKSFKMTGSFSLTKLQGGKINTQKQSLSKILRNFNTTFSEYPFLERIKSNVSSNEEIFDFVEKCHPIFYQVNTIHSYMDYIESEVSDKNEQQKYFNILINKLLKIPTLLSTVNTDMKLLSKFEKFITDDSFKSLSEKIPGLKSFFSDFKLSEVCVSEPEYSKIVFYNHVKASKELLVDKSNASIVRVFITSCIEEFSNIMKQQDIPLELHKVNIHQSKIAAIFSSSDNEVLTENYKKYQSFLHSTAKEIFIDNIIGLKSYKYSEQERLVIEYVQAQALAFDLNLLLPEAKKQSTTFKF